MEQLSRTARFWQWWAALSLRRPRLIVLLGTLAFVASIPGAARLYGDLRTDLRELLPQGAPAAVALAELERRIGGRAHLAIVVRTDDLKAGERFVDTLAATLKELPPSLVAQVHWRVDAEKEFLDRHGALYADVKDLIAARDALRSQIAKANPLLVDLEENETRPAVNLDEVVERIKAAYARLDRYPDGYLAERDPVPEPEHGIPRQHHRRQRDQCRHHLPRQVHRRAQARLGHRQGASALAARNLDRHLRGERGRRRELRLAGRGQLPRLQSVRLHGILRDGALLAHHVCADACFHRAPGEVLAFRRSLDAEARARRGLAGGALRAAGGPAADDSRPGDGGDHRRERLRRISVRAGADPVRLQQTGQPIEREPRTRLLGQARRRGAAVLPDAHGGPDRLAGKSGSSGGGDREGERAGGAERHHRVGGDPPAVRPQGSAAQARGPPPDLRPDRQAARGAAAAGDPAPARPDEARADIALRRAGATHSRIRGEGRPPRAGGAGVSHARHRQLARAGADPAHARGAG